MKKKIVTLILATALTASALTACGSSTASSSSSSSSSSSTASSSISETETPTPTEEATPTPTEEAASTQSESEDSSVPWDYTSALNSAESYSEIMHMSKAGIYDQLTSEYGDQFSAEAAQYHQTVSLQTLIFSYSFFHLFLFLELCLFKTLK